MAVTEWEIHGPSFVNCTCDWGCPCQFNKLPTHGHCHALMAFRIDKGHYGGVDLSGLCGVNVYKWPEAIHLGNGERYGVVDERANEDQRKALAALLHGGPAEETANVFQIFGMMCTKHYDTIYAPIEFEADMEKRVARVSVPDLVESSAQPIRNPVSGDEHRISIGQPEGFEYLLAEIGNGSTKTQGEVKLEFNDCYGQFSMYNLSDKGVLK